MNFTRKYKGAWMCSIGAAGMQRVYIWRRGMGTEYPECYSRNMERTRSWLSHSGGSYESGVHEERKGNVQRAHNRRIAAAVGAIHEQ